MEILFEPIEESLMTLPFLFIACLLVEYLSNRNVINKLYSRSNSLSVYYPKKIRELFEIVTSANCIPKGEQIRSYVRSFFKDRKITELFKDFFAFLKCGFDVFFGK